MLPTDIWTLIYRDFFCPEYVMRNEVHHQLKSRIRMKRLHNDDTREVCIDEGNDPCPNCYHYGCPCLNHLTHPDPIVITTVSRANHNRFQCLYEVDR